MRTVNIVRQPSPFAPQNSRTRTKSFVHLEGSVADLRKALLEDQVIQPNDKFYGVNGQPLSNNSEIHTKWTEALQGILVVGAEETEAPAEPIARPTYTCIYKTQTPAHLPIQAPIVKRVEEVPQVIYSLSSASSDTSDTKTAVTEQLAIPAPKPTCICSHQVTQPVAPPIVVVSPVEATPVIVAPVETPPIISSSVQTIPVIDTPVEIVQQPTVLTPEPELPIVVEPEPVMRKVNESATSDCPCEACQGAVTTASEPEPVVIQEVPRTGLEYDEKPALIVKSALGYGFNISDPAGPVNTNYPVVAQLAVDNVEFDAATDSDIRENVVVTSSARETAYIRNGWTASALTVEHPWAPQTAEPETRTADGLKSKTVSVTGQYPPFTKLWISRTPRDALRNSGMCSDSMGMFMLRRWSLVV
ncbi:hypothetical protein BC629DRAFT_1071515 [Irpex lacteus]|nr:hypothetical protein BC629DRAFT_1071515 [Irpex lacteus]